MHSYWIQHADFSATDYPPTDVVGAMVTFESHDWQSELLARTQLEMEGSEACDPGIGFVAQENRILHICPLNKTTNRARDKNEKSLHIDHPIKGLAFGEAVFS